MWPFGDLGIALFSGDGGVKSAAVNFGVWNSLHTGSSGSDGPSDKLHYELDFYTTLSLGFGGGVSLGTTYTAYTSPNNMFNSVKELSFKVSKAHMLARTACSRSSSTAAMRAARQTADNSSAGRRAPISNWASARAGRSATGSRRWRCQSSWVSVWATTTSGSTRTASSPTDGFGLFDIGGLATFPLTAVGSNFGSWNFHAGLNFLCSGTRTRRSTRTRAPRSSLCSASVSRIDARRRSRSSGGAVRSPFWCSGPRPQVGGSNGILAFGWNCGTEDAAVAWQPAPCGPLPLKRGPAIPRLQRRRPTCTAPPVSRRPGLNCAPRPRAGEGRRVALKRVAADGRNHPAARAGAVQPGQACSRSGATAGASSPLRHRRDDSLRWPPLRPRTSVSCTPSSTRSGTWPDNGHHVREVAGASMLTTRNSSSRSPMQCRYAARFVLRRLVGTRNIEALKTLGTRPPPRTLQRSTSSNRSIKEAPGGLRRSAPQTIPSSRPGALQPRRRRFPIARRSAKECLRVRSCRSRNQAPSQRAHHELQEVAAERLSMRARSDTAARRRAAR